MKTIFNSVISHRHGPFLAALALAAAAAFGVSILTFSLALETAAVTFFLSYLIMMAFRFPQLTQNYLRQHVETADEPAFVIIGVAVVTVAISFISLFIALNQPEGDRGGLQLALTFVAIIAGWMTIHTMAAVHYAHLYWQPDPSTRMIRAPHGGLEFPGARQACGYDFLYFAFVVGMTAQTSDVAITSTPMRKLNLLHALTSFFFNTVLVAAVVNAAVSLAG